MFSFNSYSKKSIFFVCLFLILITKTNQNEFPNCQNLYEFQYNCEYPSINSKTYQPENCQKNNTYKINCTVIEGVICNGEKNFTKIETCSFTSGKNFFVALTLSLFVGFLGIKKKKKLLKLNHF